MLSIWIAVMSGSKKKQAAKEAARGAEKEDLLRAFLVLADVSDARSLAILAAALVDGCLRSLIRSKFQNTSDILDQNGPLASFSSCCRLAHALGYINAQTKRDLGLIAQVRNKFAHSVLENLDFDDAVISNLIDKIVTRDDPQPEDLASIYRRACELIALDFICELDPVLRARSTDRDATGTELPTPTEAPRAA